MSMSCFGVKFLISTSNWVGFIFLMSEPQKETNAEGSPLSTISLKSPIGPAQLPPEVMM